MLQIKYLNGYPEPLLQQVATLLDSGQLGNWLAQRYPERHSIQTDRALYDYVSELKQRYLKNTAALARVQGGKLKSKNEIRIATLFRDTPPQLLRMIVVHELAHLKVKDHDKAFYQLCNHMEPHYHQLEFDLRLWLLAREQGDNAIG